MKYIDLVFGIAAALGGLFFYKRLPEHWLRMLVWLVIAGVCIELAAAAHVLPEKYNHAVFNPFTIGAICVNLYCFSQVFHKPWLQKISRYSIPFYLIFCIISFTFILPITKFNSVNYRVGSVLIIFLCFMFYRQLLLEDYLVDLFKTPMFFVATGLLVFYAGFFISFTAWNYLSEIRREETKLFWQYLSRILNVINYTMLLIAFTCRRKTPSYSRSF